MLQRSGLRLRPGSGLEQGRDVWRMAIFLWVRTVVCDRWSEEVQCRRVTEGLRRLKAGGVCRVAAPARWQPLARQLGLTPVDTVCALHSCAGAAVREACRALDLSARRTGLLVCGSAAAGPVHSELLALGRSMGALRLRGEGNGELLCKLCRAGVSAAGDIPGDMPVIALLLPGGEVPEGVCLTVDLRGEPGERPAGCWQPDLLPPPGAMPHLPAGVDAGDFAAALLAEGCLRPREIRVSRLDIAQHTQYNKEIQTILENY